MKLLRISYALSLLVLGGGCRKPAAPDDVCLKCGERIVSVVVSGDRMDPYITITSCDDDDYCRAQSVAWRGTPLVLDTRCAERELDALPPQQSHP